MKGFREIRIILKEFASRSTIAGLHYAFEPNQSKLSNILWMILIIILTFFGVYTSVRNYEEWKAEPVLTTLASTGLPIAEIPFPSVVICSQGVDHEGYWAAFYKLIFENLNKTGSAKINLSPIRYQRVLASKVLQNVSTILTNLKNNFFLLRKSNFRKLFHFLNTAVIK
jgi:hypothetical protein